MVTFTIYICSPFSIKLRSETLVFLLPLCAEKATTHTHSLFLKCGRLITQPITVKIFTLDFTAAVITFNMLNAGVKSSGEKKKLPALKVTYSFQIGSNFSRQLHH